jgi:hypothetical protein
MKEGLRVINFNTLKHHFRYLKMRMDLWAAMGWDKVYNELLELGENQFDIYTGNLTPDDITGYIQEQLEMSGITTSCELRNYLGKTTYRSLTLCDGSRWIIRESESGSGFVHLHPGRNQPLVIRIKALHLKTAVALFYEYHGCLPAIQEFTTLQINMVRTTRLGLSPIKSIEESRGITDTLSFLTGHS